MRRQRCPHRPGTGERTHRRGVGCGGGGRDFILGRGGLEFLELHLQLIEQLAATLRRGAEPIALHLGDQQLQMRNHRLGAGGAGLELAPCRTFRQQRRLERFDVVREGLGCTSRANHTCPQSCTQNFQKNDVPTRLLIQPVLAAKFVADSSSRFLRAYSRAAPP